MRRTSTAGSVVILTAHLPGVSALVAERDSQLLVDANAVAPCLVTSKNLEPIARRKAQVAQGRGGVKSIQFPSNHRPKLFRVPTSSPRVFSVEDVDRGRIVERPDHEANLHGYRVFVKCRRTRRDVPAAQGAWPTMSARANWATPASASSSVAPVASS